MVSVEFTGRDMGSEEWLLEDLSTVMDIGLVFPVSPTWSSSRSPESGVLAFEAFGLEPSLPKEYSPGVCKEMILLQFHSLIKQMEPKNSYLNVYQRPHVTKDVASGQLVAVPFY